MDYQGLIETYLPILKRNLISLCLGVAGMIFFVYGLIGIFGSKQPASNVVFDSQVSASQSASVNSTISVDIEGAVAAPGVYKINSDSRIQDGLIAAGGLSASADRAWVSK